MLAAPGGSHSHSQQLSSKKKMSPCEAFTLEKGARGNVRAGSTRGGGPVRRRSRGCSGAADTDGAVLSEQSCLGTRINHNKLIFSSLKPDVLRACMR